MTRGLLVSALVILLASVGPFGLTADADAQQSALPRRIGVILVGMSLDSNETKAFQEGLRNAGYVEGRDVVIDWRPANGDYARTPELAADLVQRQVEVIVVESTPAAKAAKRATSTIPIVMALVSDPVGSEESDTDDSRTRADSHRLRQVRSVANDRYFSQLPLHIVGETEVA